LHPGDFSIFVDEQSANSKSLKALLGLDEPDFRMRDAELLLRYFAYRFNINKYSGNLKKLLDETHTFFNKNWNSENQKLLNEVAEFDNAIEFKKRYLEKRVISENGTEKNSRAE
jgi:hypothetical protein